MITGRFPQSIEWTIGPDDKFRFRSGSPADIAAAQAIIDAFDPVAVEAAQQAQKEAEAKAAPYRELAILKLAKAEAEAAGDAEAAKTLGDQATAIAAKTK